MKCSRLRIVLFLVCSSLAWSLIAQSGHAATFGWTNATPHADNWTTNSHWTPNTGHPNAVGDIANLNLAYSGGEKLITLDASQTIGILNIGDTDGGRTVTLTNSGGSVLTLDNTGTTNVSINKTSTGTGSALDTISAPLLIKDNLVVANSSLGTLLISGGISEDLGTGKTLSKTGTTSVILSGTSTYTGATTVSGGLLGMTNQVSLYNNGAAAAWNTSNIVVQSGAALGFGLGGAGGFTDANIQTLNALGSGSGGFMTGSSIGLSSNDASYTYAPTITNSNGGANSIGLVAYGTNTLVLTGNNTYTGGTTLAGAVLSLGSSGAIGGTGTITFLAGTLQHTAANTTDYSSRFSTAANQAIRIDTNGQSVTYNSALSSTGGSLTKIGDGTLTLSGANTYTGVTTANAGTLQLTSSNVNSRIYNVGSGAATNANLVVTSTGSLSVGAVGQEDVTPGAGYYQEFYVGMSGGTGSADVQAGGSLTVNGWSNIGREGGTGTVNNAGTFVTTRELRVGADYAGPGGNATVNNTGTLQAERIILGINSATGTLTQSGATSSITISGPLQLGYSAGGTGTFTMNDGTFTCGDWVVTGTFGGIGTTVQHGGTINTVIFDVAQGGGSLGNYTMDSTVSASQINTTQWFVVGDTGIGTFQQSAGTTINVGTDVGIGEGNGAGDGTWTMDGGTVSTGAGFYAGDTGVGKLTLNNGTINVNGTVGGYGLIAGSYPTGNGTIIQNGGTINASAVEFTVAYDAGSQGSYTMNAGTLNVGPSFIGRFSSGSLTQTGGTITSSSFLTVGEGSGITGTHDMSAGTLNTTFNYTLGYAGTATGNISGTADINSSGDVVIGQTTTANGTLNQTGGSISTLDWTYVGLEGVGAYNLSNGTFVGDDNFSIGLNATGLGTVNVSGGSITLRGIDPAYTGNMIVGRHGSGTVNMTGGLIELKSESAAASFNSASTSVANHITDPPANWLDDAQDGNLYIAEQEGTGVVAQSGGTFIVGANVFVGGANFTTSTGGNGTLTISGTAQMRVGASSPTGGDLVLGSPFASTATVNLQGGLLDVSKGTGVIGSGGAASTKTFNFTGGTLKVKEWNPSSIVGGDLGPLVQTGATSVLDVTGNNTAINGGYSLTDGTLLAARQVSVFGDVNLSSNGELQWQMTGLNSANPGQWFGQIALTGNLVLGGTSDLELDFSQLATNGPAGTHTYWDANHSWKIIDTTTNTGSTTFATLTNGTFANGTFSIVVGAGADLGDIFLNYAAVGPAVPGDFDGDGDVDGADFVAWQTHFPTATGAVYGDGDADFDGDVDGADFVVWQTNFPFPAGPGASPVPEPTSLLLAAVSAIGLVCVRRKVRR